MLRRPIPVPIEQEEREKIVTLYRDHGLTLPRLRERLVGRGLARLARVLREEGVQMDRRSRVYQEAP